MTRKAGKLGKKPFTPKPEHLKLADYLNIAALPPLPAQFGHEQCVPADGWGMLGNDTLGDCFEAGVCHQIMAATAEGTGTPVPMTDVCATSAYHNITGWDPGPDEGTNMEIGFNY